MQNLWSENRLLLPKVPASLESELSQLDYNHVSTLSDHDPMQDYLFYPSLDYLRGNVPDHYIISHAGHGINSYSLNFRYAFGNLAVLIQVGYGGGYSDTKQDALVWNESISQVNLALTQLENEPPADKSKTRDFLLHFSNFRSDDEEEDFPGFHLEKRILSQWEEIGTFELVEDLIPFMEKN